MNKATINLPDQDKLPAWISNRVIGMMAFTICWAVLAWRRSDQWTAPQFWAEDGCIFFSDAVTLGWAALLKPYAGYLLTLPRLVAGLTRDLPWEYVPTVYVVIASLVAALTGMRVACARLPLMERVLAAIALVAVPHRGEVFLNLTNVMWILNVLLVVNLLEDPPAKTAELLRRSGELLIVGLTTPMVIVLAPYAALWLWRWRKSPRAWAMMGVWLAALLIQAVCFYHSDRGLGSTVGEIMGDLPWVIPRYAAALFVGNWLPYSPGLGWTAVIAGLIAVGVLFSDRTNPRRFFGLLLFPAAAGLLMIGRLASTQWSDPTGGEARYSYLPFVLVMWSFASLAAGTQRQAYRALALTLYGLVIWSAASNWTAPPLPNKNWPQQVREARTGLRTDFEVAPNFKFPVPPQPAQRP